MRKTFAAMLSILGVGLFVAAPANAAAKWTCVGPEYVCGGEAKSVVNSKPSAAEYAPVKARKPVASYDDRAPVKSRKKAARAAAAAYSEGSSTLSGKASYYWQPQRVASGGWFNPNAMTAAHKSLPFGTKVRVTNQVNGKSVVVTINDRGPYIAGRIIDLSKAAAGAISMTGAGVVPVKVAVLGKG